MTDERYRIRLLQDVYVEDGEPGEIQYQAGEGVLFDGAAAVAALSEGWGALVGHVTDGVLSGLPLSVPDEQRSDSE